MSVRFSRGLLYVAAPLLFVQGRRVRRVTPKLAEPEGPREGETGTGALLKLLVLGDSAAAGVGARDQAHGLLGRTVEALAPHRRVAFKLIAKTGATSASTLKFLHKQPPIAIDAALVSLGVNDLTALGSTRTTLQHLAGIDAWLLSRGAARVIYSGLPPMGRFPALPSPMRQLFGLRAERLDRKLKQFADAAPHREHLGVATLGAFDPSMSASDGFHPGEPVYALWGAAAAARLLATMAPRICDHEAMSDAANPR